MPTSIWGRIKQAYAESNRTVGDGLGLYVATIELGNSAMQQLRATPRVIVPGIPGKTIMPIQITATTPQTTNSRAGAFATHLRWRDGTTFLNASGEINRDTMHGSTTTDRFAHLNMTSAGHAQSLDGVELVLHNTGTGEYSSGNSTNKTTFRVFYAIIG